MIFLILFVINWILKLFMSWLMYLLATWLQVPEWAMIAMVAVAAAETRIHYTAQYASDRGWI